MNEHPRVLEELGQELERIADLVFLQSRSPDARARRAHGSRLGVLATCLVLLVLAAAATAAVLLIQQGSPLPAPHPQDLRSSGIPLPGSAHLAGIDAPDPSSSNPDWDLRLSRTRSGETCTAVGQIVAGRFGIVGLDHVFRALPLGSVDSCGIDALDGPILLGAHDFIGSHAGEARTVLSGVAGVGTRSVTAYVDGKSRRLKLGPQGTFITVYAGAAEDVRPRVSVVSRDGRAHTVSLDQSSAFEVKDPNGGSPWTTSTEADLQGNAAPDEDCIQVTREPTQTADSPGSLPLTPDICGHLGASPLFVQMRRFVPGEDTGPFPWHDSPSRTLVYGVATPSVKSLSLSGAGSPRVVPIDPHGGAFLAVLDGHADPRSLTLSATLRSGASLHLSRSTGLLSSQDNQPIPEQAVPAYRTPTPPRSELAKLPPFELQIPATVRETLQAEDPAGGPTWVLRSWQGSPNPQAHGAGDESYVCAELGVLLHGELVEPGHSGKVDSPLLTTEQGRCNTASSLRRMKYMLSLEAFLNNPYEYTPHPARTVISGVLPAGAKDPVLLGTGSARPLPVDSNNAFLIVLAGRYWSSSPRITYLLDGHRIGRVAGGQAPRFPLGSSPDVPQVRVPDPDGGAPWGFAATRNCSTIVGRIVDGRFASIDLNDGVLKTGGEETGESSSCITHPGAFVPARILRRPVEFDVHQIETGIDPFSREPEPFSRPEIELRTLPGRTIISGVAHSDVASVTLSTPSDVRTLRPSGPLHAVLAVYDGFFLRGNLTATVRLRDGQVETEQIQGYAERPSEPLTLAGQLREAKRLLGETRARARAHDPRLPAAGARRYEQLEAGRVKLIERHLDFERDHPGLLPPE